ncbi:IclR family transcriptional regulator [Sporomusa aerivorans]|uniref:IclR family transcriptional regulator n=1 Tax=Sporomusa aerivorans TaxID=204936 RepID=UPI003529E340
MNSTVIQSVVRAIDILKCFEDSEELGVTEISHKMGLHKSTVFNIITTLEKCHFIEKNANSGKYRLGTELFRLGTKVNISMRKIAQPYLERLASQFKETINLVIRDGNCVIYIEKIESSHSMRISTMVGGRLPINATAVGKAILAGLSDDELDKTLDELSFVKFTESTICNKNELMDYLKKVRLAKYAEDVEELEIGLTCVAAPIFDHTGKAIAAISISGPTTRMLESFREQIAEELIKVTRELSCKFGFETI